MKNLWKKIAAISMIAIMPFIAHANHDDTHRHEFTADLTNVMGISSPATGWPPVRLISRGVGGGTIITDEGFGIPRTFRPVRDEITIPNLLASDQYHRKQEYVLVVGTNLFPFVMPDAPATFASTQTRTGEVGVCTVSASAPQSPSPGDLWCDPTTDSLKYYADGAWRNAGASSGGGLTSSDRMKLEDSVPVGGISYDGSGNVLRVLDHEGDENPVELFDGECAAVEGTGAAGQVLKYKEAGSDTKPVCEWATDSTATGGTGLDAAGVRAETTSQLRQGDNITITPAGTGATQTLTIASDKYDGAPIEARVDLLEDFENSLGTRKVIAVRARIVVSQRNAAYSIPHNIDLPTTNKAGRKIEASVQTLNEPDGDTTTDYSNLVAKVRIVRENVSITSTNAIEFTNTPDNNIYRIGMDSTGNPFFGSDTTGTYYVSLAYTEPAPLNAGEVRDQTDQQLVEGTGIHFAKSGSGANQQITISSTSTGGLTQAQVDGRVEAGVEDWAEEGNTSQIPANKLQNAPTGGGDGSADTLSTTGSVPSTSGYDVGDIINVNGALYELIASTAERNVYRGVIASLASGYVGDGKFKWDEDAEAIRAFLPKSVLSSSPPATLYILVQTSSGLYAETELSRNSGTDTNDDYAYIKASGSPGLEEDARTTATGTHFTITYYSNSARTTAFNIRAAENSWVRDDRQVGRLTLKSTDLSDMPPRADHVPANDGKLLEYDSANDEYVFGDKPHPSAHITELKNETGDGLAITNSSQQRVGNFEAFSPTFDLDTAGNDSGIINAEIRITLSGRSNNNISFSATSVETTYEMTGFAFASRVKAANAYSGSTREGVRIGSVDLFLSGTKIGEFQYWIGKNAANEAGVHKYYAPTSGGYSFSGAFDEEITNIANDPGAATTATGTTFHDKDVSLQAASGSETTVGTHTNRKIVDSDSGKVRLSDWANLSLVNDSSSVGGITVAGNKIVFANAGKVWIEGSFEFQPGATGGASRLYNDLRGTLTRSSTTTMPLRLRSPTFYTKTTAHGTAEGSFGQGPPQQRGEFVWTFEVQAGDQIGIQWRAYIQSNASTPQTTTDIDSTESIISIRIAG